jgi:vacuolar protein sorting-associated protein 18
MDASRITSLEFERFPSSGINSPAKYFVILTTPTRLYQFVGGPTFESVLSSETVNFKELMPMSQTNRSILQFYAPSAQGLPASCAWLLGIGVFYSCKSVEYLHLLMRYVPSHV